MTEVRSEAMGWSRHGAPLLCLLATAGLVACGDSNTKNELPHAAKPAVTAMQVIERSTTVTADIVAEIKAFREVELRSRVTGVIDQVLFHPGDMVRKDQPLFVIDSRGFAATVNDARAGVADAEASLARIRQDIERYRPLVPENAIPKQTFEQAQAQEKQAEAMVASRKAQLDRAQLDLSYTEVRSPVRGQVGLQKVEEGALASAGSTVLVTVSTLDPVYAYFNVPEAAYVEFARRAGDARGAIERANRPIELFLPDGSAHAHTGKLDFVERAVSASTGTLQVRARFANPGALLKPGMNVRVRVSPETVTNALLVPQRAVGDLLGRQFVLVLDADDKVEQRFVEMGERSGSLWVVRNGLQASDRVIVDGLQKAQPGQIVAPSPITEADLSRAHHAHANSASAASTITKR